MTETHTLLLSLIIATAASSPADAQQRPGLSSCRKVVVQDADRRSFDDTGAFALDVDGDGRPDSVTPRAYTVKRGRTKSDKSTSKAREIHRIAFDVRTSLGRHLKSFFTYDYGTDEAGYWMYAFVRCDADGDAEADLLFYSGDDTSEETVILEYSGGVFKVRSRKTDDLEP